MLNHLEVIKTENCTVSHKFYMKKFLCLCFFVPKFHQFVLDKIIFLTVWICFLLLKNLWNYTCQGQALDFIKKVNFSLEKLSLTKTGGKGSILLYTFTVSRQYSIMYYSMIYADGINQTLFYAMLQFRKIFTVWLRQKFKILIWNFDRKHYN